MKEEIEDQRSDLEKGQCLTPILIKNPKKFPLPGDYSRIYVPCGKCNFCLQRRRKEWSFRLFEEFRQAENAFFITLTYDDEHLPLTQDTTGSLCKSDAKKLMKSINDRQRKEGLRPARYYLTGEYGTNTKRPHYHLIIFNIGKKTEKDFRDGKIWDKGLMYWKGVGVESIEYVTKYLIDSDDEYETKEKTFSIMSKRPGLGSNYMKKQSWHYTEEMKPDEIKYHALFKGKKHILPRYYKDRIFPDKIKSLMKSKLTNEIQRKQEEEANRLSHFMDDPYAYMNEARLRDHENIRVKSKKLNKKF